MRALVTGGTGFVGANLVDGLTAAGYTARILRRRSSRLEALAGLTYEEAVGDILDYESLVRAMAGCDWVFHVAAVSDYWRQGVAWLYRVNVEGTRTVLRAGSFPSSRSCCTTESATRLCMEMLICLPSVERSWDSPARRAREPRMNGSFVRHGPPTPGLGSGTGSRG